MTGPVQADSLGSEGSRTSAPPSQPGETQQEEPRTSARPTGEEAHERLLRQGRSSTTPSISTAVVIKDGSPFFLCEPDGDVPLDERHGLGFYFHDCRYLKGYELRLGGERLLPLVSSAAAGSSALLELTNPDVRMTNGHLVPRDEIGVRWLRTLDRESLALHDVLTFRNFGIEAIALPLMLTFSAEFADVFAVRGMSQKHQGVVRGPDLRKGQMVFSCEGQDGLLRTLRIECSPKPDRAERHVLQFDLKLDPSQSREINVSVFLTETKNEPGLAVPANRRPDLKGLRHSRGKESSDWIGAGSQIRTDSLFFNELMQRSLKDLHMLRTRLARREYFAAGTPWYVALFGRDSLITCLESLAYTPRVAEPTLRLLAALQGSRVDEYRDEEPGKILHELRVGEMAHTGEIPQTPYYGSVDSTPLFLLLVAEQAQWTGSLDLFQELRANIDSALAWIDKYGDRDHDGYVEYQTGSSSGLLNQGWKDSGDAISNTDGSLAEPPIALVEVQGLVYAAKRGLAPLYERAGDGRTADRLRKEAETLRKRFNNDFWLKDRKFFAIALQKGGRPAGIITSNPGQALWTGIVDEDKAGPVSDRLMTEDVFSGWGVRTLSTKELRYNPIGYHLGTVWPHDNALIAAGLRRYGFDQAAEKIASGLLAAAAHFHLYRLPEVFAGFDRNDYSVPVHYPVACHPQAWAAASVPFLVHVLLGLRPAGFERELHIVRPLMPFSVRRLELRGLQVAGARIDLRFEQADGGALVDVLRVDGDVEVLVHPPIRPD